MLSSYGRVSRSIYTEKVIKLLTLYILKVQKTLEGRLVSLWSTIKIGVPLLLNKRNTLR